MPNDFITTVACPAPEAGVVRDRMAQVRDCWPVAAIGIGLLASAAWSLALLYGAYLLGIRVLS